MTSRGDQLKPLDNGRNRVVLVLALALLGQIGVGKLLEEALDDVDARQEVGANRVWRQILITQSPRLEQRGYHLDVELVGCRTREALEEEREAVQVAEMVDKVH